MMLPVTASIWFMAGKTAGNLGVPTSRTGIAAAIYAGG
jgi:hypothetical protein